MSGADSKYLEIAYSSIRVFANDGKLDEQELSFLLGMALKDNQIDADERRVLKNIFDQIRQGDVTAVVWQRISDARKTHSI